MFARWSTPLVSNFNVLKTCTHVRPLNHATSIPGIHGLTDFLPNSSGSGSISNPSNVSTREKNRQIGVICNFFIRYPAEVERFKSCKWCQI